MATTTSNMSLTLPAVSDAADIGVLNSNFQKIDDQLGGKGLGVHSVNTAFIDTIAKLDALRVNRWFIFTGYSNSDPIQASGLTINYAYGRVDNYNENNAKMTLWPYSPADPYNKCELTRYCIENEWTEWEWVNPPMIPGVEYRTTERWNGKPVYTMLVNCGEMVSGASVTYAQNVTTIRFAGFAGGVPLPYLGSSGFNGTWSIWMQIKDGTITVYGGSGYANTTINTKAQVWYTKN